MRNICFLALTALFFSACKEKPIEIPDLVIGERKVLIEEQTGVSCTNCPKGAAEIKSLTEQFGDKIVVVSIHAGSPGYTVPLPQSRYDFRVPDAQAIMDNNMYTSLGDPGSPSASINRAYDPLDDLILRYRDAWGGLVATETQKDEEMDIFIVNKYNEALRQLTVTTNIVPKDELNGALKLSVYLTEDSIVDAQLKDGVVIQDYLHRHAFRDALTDVTGDPLPTPMPADVPVSRTFTITLPANWNAHHCSIVAFVHRTGDYRQREVLQVEEAHVK